MNEAEYVKRYAARIEVKTGAPAKVALECASIALEHALYTAQKLEDPEGDADSQISNGEG